jgi:hypothetical protein
MAKPPLEKTITNSIIKWLNTLDGTRARKMPSGPYGSGWPDIICVHHGLAVFIEVKRPGKVPTPLQWAELNSWSTAGAECFVTTSLEDFKSMFTP